MIRLSASALIVPAMALGLTSCSQIESTLSDVDSGFRSAVRSVESALVGKEHNQASADTLRAAKLMDGDGVARDPQAAVALLRPHAENGYAEAQLLLGLAYSAGQGVAKDRAKALHWYEKAADQNNAQAQYLMGLARLNGDGIAKDTDKAAYWFAKGAENGNAGAQYHLAIGLAGNDRFEEALRWLEVAARQGHADAQYLAGEFYQIGRGTAVDKAWATHWFGKAAAQGVVRAQYMLGLAYAAPSGVPRDLDKAYFWLAVASAGGDERATEYRDKVGKLVAESQRSAIAARATKWQPTTDQADAVDDRPSLVFIQYALSEAGYDPGPVDGLMGPRTGKAIARYREEHGIGGGSAINAALLYSLKNEKATAG
jgi:TPR repeat protein